MVIFLSTTGDPLDDTQQAAFERYIRGGGGYAGIHAAADTEYTWTWYGKLVGAYFRNHPSGTPEADVLVEDLDHHSTKTLPARWHRTDEWYNYQQPDGAVVGGGGTDFSPRAAGVHVLVKMDESTYDEDDGNTTDDDHPISWCHRYDGGRSFYTGMGHTQASFSEPLFLDHLLGGLEVAAGVVPDDDCGNGPANQAPTVSALRNPGGDVQPGDPVAFTSVASDPDGDTLSYAWDFGDGASATTKDAMHTYTDVGVYYAKVTVKDGKGGTDSDLVKVTVTPLAGDNTQEVGVGGVVPGVLSLEIKGSANFGAFMPAVARDYTAALAATATSSATAAELTVRDPSTVSTGHLVNGGRALAHPLQVRATDADNPNSAYGSVPENGARLRLLSVPAPFTRAPGDDRLQAVDRRHRAADHRRLRQDPGVHALGHHAVGDSRAAARLARPPGGVGSLTSSVSEDSAIRVDAVKNGAPSSRLARRAAEARHLLPASLRRSLTESRGAFRDRPSTVEALAPPAPSPNLSTTPATPPSPRPSISSPTARARLPPRGAPCPPSANCSKSWQAGLEVDELEAVTASTSGKRPREGDVIAIPVGTPSTVSPWCWSATGSGSRSVSSQVPTRSRPHSPGISSQSATPFTPASTRCAKGAGPSSATTTSCAPGSTVPSSTTSPIPANPRSVATAQARPQTDDFEISTKRKPKRSASSKASITRLRSKRHSRRNCEPRT